MKTKTVLLCAAALGFAACFSASPAKKYYQIDPLSAPLERSLDKVLQIDRVEVASLYDDFRILYRVSPYEVNYYAYHFWAEKPSKILQGAILHYMEKTGAFRRVQVDPAKGGIEPDWILRTFVYQIEEVDAAENWSARLSMRLEIVDSKTGTVLSFRRFDRTEPLSRKTVFLVPSTISEILGQELAALLRGLPGK